MILDHYQKHVRKSIHTMANPKQKTKAYYVSLFIKKGTINYVSLSSPKHNIGWFEKTLLADCLTIYTSQGYNGAVKCP